MQLFIPIYLSVLTLWKGEMEKTAQFMAALTTWATWGLERISCWEVLTVSLVCIKLHAKWKTSLLGDFGN